MVNSSYSAASELFQQQSFIWYRFSKSQVYPLMFGSQEIPVYCHMGNFGCGGGGWTHAMKVDGKKVCDGASFSQQLKFFPNRI